MIGTKNILKACKDNNINILVYTSSASVVSKLGYYGLCKTEAERLVLEANGHKLSNGIPLRTCALRLPAMYGEGGTDVLGSIKRNIVMGSTFIRSGDDSTQFQTAYAGNMAWGFVCTIRELLENPSNAEQSPSGLAIGVTDNTPLESYCETLYPFLKLLRLKPSFFIIPFIILYTMAFFCELFSFLLQPLYLLKLPLSKVAVAHMHCLPVFDPDEAQMYLKYSPIYEYKDCVKKSVVYLEHELKQ